ncbi:MAG: Sua5/YciO/YrdC/YwlC family protein, partial [Synechococcaceae cyanobacterium]|nr:Sua5/YciO/YrdC/YwlC family protein [Synechococcaceae cyanobacterium]
MASPSPAEGAAPARLRLLCRGVVQGVGFRPCVHRLAAGLGLRGSAENVAAGVQLDLLGPRPRLEAFLARLRAALPAAARLEPLAPQWLPAAAGGASAEPPGLRIAAAAPRPLGIGLFAPALAADRAPCPACLAELADPANRRHGYPFISCSTCGPRYTIATAEPFARAHTTLASFALCPACRREFEDPADRRFHAETIGCPACGPRLRLLDGAGRPLPGDPLAGAVARLRRGRILALQGVGGFQLLVDAADPAAVERLRRRKRRPAKPFALLAASPEPLEALCRITAAEREVLAAAAAPIVLLRRRPGTAAALPAVAPG